MRTVSPVSLSAVMAPILDFHGTPLGWNENFDVEAVTIDDGIAHIGIERTNGDHALRSERRPAHRARRIRSHAPRNARMAAEYGGRKHSLSHRRKSAFPGAIVVIGERTRRGADSPARGFILDGEEHHAFDVARHDWFDITDMEFLENGDILLLERRYRILRDVGARIRRLPAADLRPGALLDGPVIFEAGTGQQIDNMEGLTSHRTQDGRLVLSLISDDNFSILQRTLLLEFYYDDAD